MTNKRAKDVMVPMSDFLTPDIRLTDAVRKMRATRRSDQRLGVKGLPVVDEGGRLIGMLSFQEMKKAIFPFYMNMMELGDVAFDGMFESMARKLAGKTVGEVMSKTVEPVGVNAPLMECIDHLIKHNLTRVPVVDDAGRVVGVVYETDLFNIIVDILLTMQAKSAGDNS